MNIKLTALFFLLVFALFPASLFSDNLLDSEVINLVSVRKVDGGKLVCVDSLLVQINTRKGEDASEFALQYSKKDKISIESAWIEDFSGNIVRKLKSGDVLTRNLLSRSSLYQDEFIKEFQLKHNVYPYRIFLCYKTTYNDFLYIAGWRPVTDIWQHLNTVQQSVKSAKLVVEIPKNYEIKYKCEHIEQPQIENGENKTVYRWQTAYKGQKAENLAPYSALKIPQVTVLPLHFKYGVKGSFATWESFGEWYKKLNSNILKLPDAEKQKIDNLLRGVTGKREKIKLLYKYLQNSTRYVNVKINTGGLKSYSAEYVANNKYGDCKALSTFMIALLEYAGIPANYVLIHAGNEIKEVDADFPEQVFNHVIVAVPLENETLFLECTNKNIPCGYMGTFTQNRKALLVGEKSHLIHIPALTEKDVECSMKTEANLSSDYNSVKINLTQRGYAYGLYSHIANNWNNADFEQYLRNALPTASRVENYAIGKNSEDLPKIDLSVRIMVHKLFETYGKDIIVNPFSRSFLDVEPPSERTQAVQLDYPRCYSDTNRYILPANQFSSLQNADSRNNSFTKEKTTKYGEYSYTCTFSEDCLTVIKNRKIFAGKYEIDEYADFYAFIKELKQLENQQIHLK